MGSSKLRDEYVQNDVGKVWQGSSRRYSGKNWVFGQFDDTVLPASCFVLQQCMRESDRGNVVKVARAISKMVRFKLSKKLKSSVFNMKKKFKDYLDIKSKIHNSIGEC